MALGGDDHAPEPRRARSAALGFENDIDAAHLHCGSQHAHDHMGCPAAAVTVDMDAPQYKRDYRRKIVYFRSQLAMRLIADTKCDVCVCRGWVFEDNFAAIMRLRSEDRSSMRARTRSTMAASPASDSSSSRTRCSTRPTACSSTRHTITTLQINLASGVKPEHLDYFKFIGRVLGLAVFHDRFFLAGFL